MTTMTSHSARESLRVDGRRRTKMSSSDKKRRFAAVLRRDGDLCHYCMVKTVMNFSNFGEEKNRHATLDHVIPPFRGGTNRITNLVIACFRCNKLKGPMTREEFLASGQFTQRRFERTLESV